MLNNLPTSTSLNEVFDFISSLPRYSERNRALFACRLELRIKDICLLTLDDVLHASGQIQTMIISKIDGLSFQLSKQLRTEIDRYIRNRFNLGKTASLERVFGLAGADTYLFSTQKASRFSANTLGQHYSLLDREIHNHFLGNQRLLMGRQRYLNATQFAY